MPKDRPAPTFCAVCGRPLLERTTVATGYDPMTGEELPPVTSRMRECPQLFHPVWTLTGRSWVMS